MYQFNLFDMIPKRCECGCDDIRIDKVGQGIALSYCPVVFEHWLYHCECVSCGAYSTDNSLLHWMSQAKTREQAIKEWNTNPHKGGKSCLIQEIQ